MSSSFKKEGKSENFEVQVPSDQYFETYDDLKRFISYYYQIRSVKLLNPKSVLEVGIGNKTVYNYLKAHGFNIDSCDFDSNLNPDYVADIRDLPFENESYDVILASEILEHLPWKDLDKALSELYRVSKRYVIISIPYASLGFEVAVRFPRIERLLKRSYLDFLIRIPLFFSKLKFNGEHYWEMGRKGFPKKRIIRKFSEKFKIVREVRPILNYHHHFFVLEKK